MRVPVWPLAVQGKKMTDQYPSFAKTRFAVRWSSRLLCVLTLTAFSSAQDQSDLTQLSPEQLSKMEVTSVSKKEQKLSDTAAAVYVITQQDIHNSTATSIPELLQTVPGLDVARINGSQWAITARGFNGLYQDRLLVLVDGRSVFDPLFGGALWDEQDFILEDIERIEVIRGPGSTMWGANATNGIINIITKSAKDTQGALVSAGVGDQERSSTSARYGGKIGKSTSFRIYSKYQDDGPAGTLNGQPSHDSSRFLRSGFRMDSTASSQDSFMLEGQGFSGTSGVDSVGFSYVPPFTSNYVDDAGQQGENLVGRWTHKSLDASETTLQASYAHVAHPETGLDVNGDVAAVSIQHEMALGNRHDLVTGVEYDFKNARTSSTHNLVWWNPSNPTTSIASAFIQDEMLFANGKLRVTLGLRLEHHNISGFAIHPNTRALWKLSPVNTVWLAYSRANLSPGPDDTALNLNLAAFPGVGGTQVLRLTGNPNIKAEKLNAFELGYRIQPGPKVSFDLATFYNHYTDLISPELGQPFFEAGPPSRLVLPLVQDNDVRGISFGGEFAAKWTPVNVLSFTAAYSFIALDTTQAPETFGNPANELNGATPRHQASLTSSAALAHSLRLNTTLGFVDSRTAQNIPGYTHLDTGLVWRPLQAGEFRIGSENMFNKEHIAFIDPQAGLSTQLGRSFYTKAIWRF
jgi:iron complex outermembrane receptor protein